MKYVFIILISLLSFTACNYLRNPELDFQEILDNQEKCFLDFRLGMRDYNYEKVVKELISDGILQETLIPREHKPVLRILTYNFQTIGLKGELWPLIPYDRLERLSISFEDEVGKEKNTAITKNEYKKIVSLLKKKYGNPNEINYDSFTKYTTTVWEEENFILSASIHPAMDESKNRILITYYPNDSLQKAFDIYIEEKKIEERKLQ